MVSLNELATLIDGTVHGDGTLTASRAVHPGDAASETDLGVALSKEVLKQLPESRARIALVSAGTDVAATAAGPLVGWVTVGNPRIALAAVTRLFDPGLPRVPGAHPSSVVDDGAEVDPSASIGPFCHVAAGARVGSGTHLVGHVTVGPGARIGSDCLFHPGARLGHGVRIGSRVILHHNASIGADGFSFLPPRPGHVDSAKQTGATAAAQDSLMRIHSLGAVELADDVEVGANTAIDRGTFRSTRIGRNTKIDDLVMIGHNCVIGDECMLCGQVGLAGSVTIGDRVVLAGQVGIADHVTIGSDSVVGAGSGVASSLPTRSVVVGYPAVPKEDMFEQTRYLRRLKRLYRDVDMLKKAQAGGNTDPSFE